jgi:leader peptidase (prepilin peptidase)/N-methyltransferase
VWNTLIFGVIGIIFGLVFGSFYNVLIYRIPKGISLVNPKKSFCPVCNHQLAWKDNIPILSYLVLGGKCRYCGSKISPLYPVIEGSTAALFLLAVFLTSNIWNMLALWILFSGGIIVTAIDLQTMMIPDFAVIMTAVGGVLWAIANGQVLLSLISAGIGFGIFLIIHLVSKQGMGFGDVEYIAALALYLVPFSLVWAILIASIAAIIFALPMLITRKANRKTHVPFGPFLALGVSIAIFIPWR